MAIVYAIHPIETAASPRSAASTAGTPAGALDAVSRWTPHAAAIRSGPAVIAALLLIGAAPRNARQPRQTTRCRRTREQLSESVNTASPTCRFALTTGML